MNAKDFVVDDSREWNVVEDLGAVLPHADRAVLSETLVVEAVHLGDLPRLVIATYERDAIRVAHFERQQEQERLDRVEAAIDEIAEEQVVRLGYVATDAKQLFQIVELSVNVAANGDRRVDFLYVALLG